MELGFTPYEQVEHTGDLAYVARGRTMEELFRHASLGLVSFLIEPALVRPDRKVPINAEGDDPEECLVDWLQEILYRVENRRFLFHDFRIDSCESCRGEPGPTRVRGAGIGEEPDPRRHQLLTELKAVTYHDLKIQLVSSPVGPLYTVRIVVDV